MTGNNYRWFLGFVAVLVIAVVAISGHGGGGPGALGLKAGTPLPPFAVPLATAATTCDRPQDPCDANVATRAGQKRAGSRPACEVRGPAILNACELAERGPLVLAMLGTTRGGCADALDRLTDVARRHPGVQVAVVAIGGKLADVRAVVAEHRWRFSVGWDRDAILARIYGVAVCPYVTVVRWRGRVQRTLVSEFAPGELDRQIGAAVVISRRAGWRPVRGA